jgi:hypothetical protein
MKIIIVFMVIYGEKLTNLFSATEVHLLKSIKDNDLI